MHRYPYIGAYQLCSNDAQYFGNTLSNDVLLTSKFDWQRIIVSPITLPEYSTNESVMAISRSNVRVVGVQGMEINTHCNIRYNGLRITNSNIGSNASVRSIITNDRGDLELSLNSSAYTIQQNSLSNVKNVASIRNFTGDVLLAGKSMAPSLFINSNDGFVGINHTKPETWLHIQASNAMATGHAVIERTATGGFGGQMTLKNATPTQAMGNATSLAFQLYSNRLPYTTSGNDNSHAQISAYLDSNNTDHTSIRFASRAVEKMRLSTDGYLGLGMAKPDTVFHMKALADDTANIYLGSNLATGYMVSKVPGGNLNIQRGGLTTSNNVMSFTTGGRIGVRETDPVADLQMYSQSNHHSMNMYIGSNGMVGYLMSKYQDGNLNFQRGLVTDPQNVLSMTTAGRIGVRELYPITDLQMYGQNDHQAMNVYMGSNAGVGYLMEKKNDGNLNFKRGVLSTACNVVSLTTAGLVGLREQYPVTDLQMYGQNDHQAMNVYLGSNAGVGYLLEKKNDGNLNFKRGVLSTACNVVSLTTTGKVGIREQYPVTDLQMYGQNDHQAMNVYLGSNAGVGYLLEKKNDGNLNFKRGAFSTACNVVSLTTAGLVGLREQYPVTDLQMYGQNDHQAMNVYLGSNAGVGYLLQKKNDGNLNFQCGNYSTACNVVSLTTTGKVGIREQYPVTDLQMYGQNDHQAMNIYLGSNASVGYLLEKQSNGNLNFRRGLLSATNNNVISLTTAGKIGVRETNPITDLHMYAQDDAGRMDVYLGSNTTLGYMIRKDNAGNFDVSRGLYNSLALVLRLGSDSRAIFRGQVKGIDGSANEPTFSFENDSNSGIYRVSDNILGFSTNGTLGIQLESDQKTQFLGQIKGINGTSAAPTFSFQNDNDMGMYRVSADVLGFSTGAILGIQLESDRKTQFMNQVKGIDGNVSVPTFSFQNDTNMGMYRAGDDFLGFATAGILGIQLENDRKTQFMNQVKGIDGNAIVPAFSFQNDTNMGMYRAGDDFLGFATGGVLGIQLENDRRTQFMNQVKGYDGSAGAPTFSFQNDTNMGMYRISDNELGFSTNGNLGIQLENDRKTKFMNQVKGYDGSAGAPTFSFQNDTNMGMYRISDNELGFSTNGVLGIQLENDRKTQFMNQVKGVDGSSGAPTFSFQNDINMGMYRAGDDFLGFATGGVLGIQLENDRKTQFMNQVKGVDGNAGVPAFSFQNANSIGMYRVSGNDLGFSTSGNLRVMIENGGKTQFKDQIKCFDGSMGVPSFSFQNDDNTGMFRVSDDTLGFSTNGTERVRINSTGNVTISGGLESSSLSTLTVNGKIKATGDIISGNVIGCTGYMYVNNNTNYAIRGTAALWGTWANRIYGNLLEMYGPQGVQISAFEPVITGFEPTFTVIAQFTSGRCHIAGTLTCYRLVDEANLLHIPDKLSARINLGLGSAATRNYFDFAPNVFQSSKRVGGEGPRGTISMPDEGRLGWDAENAAIVYKQTSALYDPGIVGDRPGWAFTMNFTSRAFLYADVGSTSVLNFTGQHRCAFDTSILQNNFDEDMIGLIVVSSGRYKKIDPTLPDIFIDDCLPIVSLCDGKHKKSIFGVLSRIEGSDDKERVYATGNIEFQYEKSPDDVRVYVNSLGEGGIWVCNQNGNIENGDFITSSDVPGYGMRQDDDVLHNYTVGKITCDCNFDDLPDFIEKRRTITRPDGLVILCAFIGCTYHCG